MLGKIIGALGQVAEAGGTIVGIRSGTEEPDFTVERKIGNVEIRRYGPRIAAETAIAAVDSFRVRRRTFSPMSFSRNAPTSAAPSRGA